MKQSLLVEYVEQHQQYTQVDKLPPALHSVGQHDLPPTMPLCVLPVFFRLLCGTGGGHRILATNANAKYELCPGVHDDPSIDGGAIGNCQQDDAQKYDRNVNEHGDFAAYPVTQDAKTHLANEDANELQVCGGLCPGL